MIFLKTFIFYSIISILKKKKSIARKYLLENIQDYPNGSADYRMWVIVGHGWGMEKWTLDFGPEETTQLWF